MAIRTILDTNALHGNKWRNSEAMKTFSSLCRAGLLQCFIPHVVSREISSQSKLHQEQEISNVSTAFKKLKRYSLPPTQYKIIENSLRELEKNKTSILEKPHADFIDWCNSINSVNIPLAKEHSEIVINSYFEGLPPFKQVKSREDFPDAFIYECVKDFSDEQIFFICQDENLRKSCEKIPNVTTLKTIEDLIAHPIVIPLIFNISAQNSESQSEAFTPHWVNIAKVRLKEISNRSKILRTGLIKSIMDNLFLSNVQSPLIASHDYKGQVVQAGIADIHFHTDTAIHLGGGRFSITFVTLGRLSLQYYVDEDAVSKVKGEIVESKRVYRDVAQYRSDFNAEISGRVTLELTTSSIERENILEDYKSLNLDEIENIILKEDIS